ncbi:MAG: coenzyme F420-0:L-glutamate ligase [Sedimentisphaerales bacterium]|jgi:coenzyme F420-0:L-glutamate ligase/coenzyme F420-1:gamma-L-glutamate ligase
MKKIEVFGLQTIPKIKQGDNLAEIVYACAEQEITGLQKNDIVILTSKIVSKAQGRTRRMADVVPGEKALYISSKTGKDAQWLQMIFDEGNDILAIMPLRGVIEKHIFGASENAAVTTELVEHEQALCITMGKDGRLHTCDAGIDGSNHEKGVVSLLPEDPDQAAKDIREQLQKLTGKKLAVILADTEMIPFGTMDFAIGSSGIDPVSKQFGQKDIFDKPKFGGIDLIGHELCSASALVFGQTGEGIPVAIVRGYEYKINENANVANTLLPGFSPGVSAAIKQTLIATSYTKPFLKRLLMRIAARFM